MTSAFWHAARQQHHTCGGRPQQAQSHVQSGRALTPRRKLLRLQCAAVGSPYAAPNTVERPTTAAATITVVEHQQQQQQGQRAAPPSPSPIPRRDRSHLRDPAHVGATATAQLQVPDAGGDVSLETYMHLPIEQYYILDPQQITFLEGTRFTLSVPRISILGAWLEPQVEVSVRQEEGAVVLEAERCRLKGSPGLEALHLDERFAMHFCTRLTWVPGATHSAVAVAAAADGAGVAAAASSSGNGVSNPHKVAPATSAAALPQHQQQQQPKRRFNLKGLKSLGRRRQAPGGGAVQHSQATAAAAAKPLGLLKGESKLEVWCEVFSPFNLMPRNVLEGATNAVLNTVVGGLLPVFLRQLGADYGKWCSDEQYRVQRAARSKPLMHLESLEDH